MKATRKKVKSYQLDTSKVTNGLITSLDANLIPPTRAKATAEENE